MKQVNLNQKVEDLVSHLTSGYHQEIGDISKQMLTLLAELCGIME